MKTQDANIFRVFSLAPSVCLKGNTTLSHCAGLAQMSGEIGQRDSMGPGTFTVQSPRLSVFSDNFLLLHMVF